jgi:hypothetical protein
MKNMNSLSADFEKNEKFVYVKFFHIIEKQILRALARSA